MIFYAQELDDQVFGVKAASRDAVETCRRLLGSSVLAGYRERNEPAYSALASGYEAVLRSKLSMALAVQGNIDAALVESRAAHGLAKGASFTRGLTPQQVVAMITIDMAIIHYCGKRNAHEAIRLLDSVGLGDGPWVAYAASVLGRIYIETGQRQKGLRHLSIAMIGGIEAPTAYLQARAVLDRIQRGEQLTDALRLNIRLLVADA